MALVDGNVRQFERIGAERRASCVMGVARRACGGAWGAGRRGRRSIAEPSGAAHTRSAGIGVSDPNSASKRASP